MKKTLSVLFAIGFAATAFCAPKARKLEIVRDSRALVSIVTESRQKATMFAAQELASYIEKMSGAKVRVAIGRRVSGNVISLDDAAELEKEEFTIEIDARNLRIKGGSPRAVLYAAYEVLERLGCGFYSIKNELVPKKKTLELEFSGIFRSKPSFAWRQVHSQYAYNIAFKPKLRINGSMWTYPTPANLGGWDDMAMGQALAGLNRDVRKKLFAEHPEWFAWREKEQRHVENQFCTLNENVIAAVEANIRRKFPKNPSVIRYQSVSFADNNKICQCKKCQKHLKKHKHASSLILECANRVARSIAKDLPNVRIVTLAYWITSTPPKDMKLEPNVTICWAMLRNFAVPPSEVPRHDATLSRWLEMASGNVVIWDYNAQFRGFLLPTPIIDMMGPGLRGYEKMKIKGVLMQMAGFGTALMDFAELRAWLCAKLMWNAQQDEWALIHEWCDGACGKGSPFVKEWLAIRKKARDRKRKYGPYDPDSRHVFTIKELVKGYDLMMKALEATEGDDRTHEQIRRISLSPITALICCYNFGVPTAAKSMKVDVPSRDKLVDVFEEICRKYKVTGFGEGMPSIAEFIKRMRDGGELLKK